MRNEILIIIPTYNEARNIAEVLSGIAKNAPQSHVLVIDDNSPDKTAEKVKELKKTYPHLHLIERTGKLGLGSAYIAGFNFALERDYQIIVQMDADLSHQAHYLPFLLKELNNYDLVIGSRYISGGSVSDWPFSRIILSWLANNFARFILKVKIRDLTSGFKCSRREALEKMGYADIISRGYAFQIEMVYRAVKKGFRIKEVPIMFLGRRREKSKMTAGIAREAFGRVIYLRLFKRQ